MTLAEFYSGLRFLLCFGNSTFTGVSSWFASQSLVLKVLAVVKFIGMAALVFCLAE